LAGSTDSLLLATSSDLSSAAPSRTGAVLRLPKIPFTAFSKIDNLPVYRELPHFAHHGSDGSEASLFYSGFRDNARASTNNKTHRSRPSQPAYTKTCDEPTEVEQNTAPPPGNEPTISTTEPTPVAFEPAFSALEATVTGLPSSSPKLELP
jgi:hypothetical protein